MTGEIGFEYTHPKKPLVEGVKRIFNRFGKPAPGALIEAVRKNDVEAVKSLLKRGAEVGERGDSQSAYCTPLHTAASRGSADIMRVLLDAGADPNEKNKNGAGVLSVADNPECARLLLEKGVPIDAKDNFGDTALMYAATGREKVIRFLIDQGASLGEQNKQGWTAVAIARSLRQVKIEKILLIAVTEAAEKARIYKLEAPLRKKRALHAAVVLQRSLPYKKPPFRLPKR